MLIGQLYSVMVYRFVNYYAQLAKARSEQYVCLMNMMPDLFGLINNGFTNEYIVCLIRIKSLNPLRATKIFIRKAENWSYLGLGYKSLSMTL